MNYAGHYLYCRVTSFWHPILAHSPPCSLSHRLYFPPDEECGWWGIQIRGKASYLIQSPRNLHRLQVPFQFVCLRAAFWLIWAGISNIWAVLPKHTWQLCLCVGRKKFHPACFNSIHTSWKEMMFWIRIIRSGAYSSNCNSAMLQFLYATGTWIAFVSTANKK